MIKPTYKGKDFFEKEVAYLTGLDTEIKFTLTPAEIKHIKRCLRMRDIIHPSMQEMGDRLPGLTESLRAKFSQFGELVPRYSKGTIKRARKIGKQCSFPGCFSEVNLEEHHKTKIANGGDNDKENLVYYCTKHHDLIELEYVLKRKELELLKLKDKIKKLREGSNE